MGVGGNGVEKNRVLSNKRVDDKNVIVFLNSEESRAISHLLEATICHFKGLI